MKIPLFRKVSGKVFLFPLLFLILGSALVLIPLHKLLLLFGALHDSASDSRSQSLRKAFEKHLGFLPLVRPGKRKMKRK